VKQHEGIYTSAGYLRVSYPNLMLMT